MEPPINKWGEKGNLVVFDTNGILIEGRELLEEAVLKGETKRLLFVVGVTPPTQPSPATSH
jgi:hypothetical protein